jgi:DNA helicase HerA-like ATPase
MPIEWRPGEHVVVAGTTGSGKTHLIDRLLRENRTHVIVFKTKDDPEDRTKYWKGFRRIEKASGIDDTRYSRFLLAPPLGKFPRQYEHQIREGHALVARVWKQGHWTVVFDERWYCEKFLGLEAGINMLETQGRSKGLTIVSGIQRPVEVSRFALSQAGHVFMFRGDNRDADTLGRATTRDIRTVVEGLTGHDFAYWHTRSRTIMRGNTRALPRIVAPLVDGTASGAKR